MQEELYFSPIVPELQHALPYKLLEDFKGELRKQDEAGNITRKMMFDKFLEHMNVVVNNLK